MLAVRTKIARGAKGIDVNPSVQHLLNCGGVGSCHGCSVDGPYQWLKKTSATGTGISFETSQVLRSLRRASVRTPTGHTPPFLNIARTCGSFDSEGGSCSSLNAYPNATISDYGPISGISTMQKEFYQRGPTACGIDALSFLNWNQESFPMQEVPLTM